MQLVRESQIRCARLPKAHRRLANSAKCPINRAPIIGGTTGGGAHPVSSHRIHAHFLIGMPFARAINPISKTNWEGTGVEPDVKAPAPDALATPKNRRRKTPLEINSELRP